MFNTRDNSQRYDRICKGLDPQRRDCLQTKSITNLNISLFNPLFGFMKHLAALILSYFLIPVGIIILVFTELSRELKLKKIRIYL